MNDGVRGTREYKERSGNGLSDLDEGKNDNRVIKGRKQTCAFSLSCFQRISSERNLELNDHVLTFSFQFLFLFVVMFEKGRTILEGNPVGKVPETLVFAL